jgi:hypothetical protein
MLRSAFYDPFQEKGIAHGFDSSKRAKLQRTIFPNRTRQGFRVVMSKEKISCDVMLMG